MPPLRERIDDLPELARLFLERYRGKFRKPVRGISDSALKILAVVLVARQHPRAREPHRAARRGQRQGLDHRRGSAARVPLRQARLGAAVRRSPVPGSVRHVRAQLHPARAREVRLERHRHGALPRHPAEHAQAQDGPPRPARHRPQAARRLSRQLATSSGQLFDRSGQPTWPDRPARLARFWPRLWDKLRFVPCVHRVSSMLPTNRLNRSSVRRPNRLFGQVAPSSEYAVAISQPQRRTDLPDHLARVAIPLSEHTSRPRSAHAALDVQRPCPPRRPERGLPDEHVHRCPADRVDRRGGAAGSNSSTAMRPAGRARSATPSARSPSTASSSRAATPIATTCSEFFHEVRESREQLRMTVLTTLQCNFACDYCIQGDHGDYNKHAAKMSLETAARVGDWAEQRLDALRPRKLRADVLRRRAAAQPAGDVLPRRAAVEGLRRARRPHARSTSSPTGCC